MTQRNSPARPAPPLPAVGKALPMLEVRDADLTLRRLWELKQRHQVVLVFPHAVDCSSCRGWLLDLAGRASRLNELSARAWVVIREPAARLRTLRNELDLPETFTLLADPEGTVHARYAPDGGAVYVGDRYLQCLACWVRGPEHPLAPLDDVLAVLAFADQEDCGCGLPAWPDFEG
jgi:peroxiredoxin